MHDLIKPIFQTLSLNKDKMADCLLIRHSVRFPINDKEKAFDAGLTPDGEKLAQEFGKYIRYYRPLGLLVTSPVGRCIDTALRISEGANSYRNILPDYRLSHSFVAEPLIQLKNYQPGQPIPEKIWRVLQSFLAVKSKGLTIAVTHDTVLVSLVAYLIGVAVGPGEWPDYLEGIAFWKGKNRLEIGWRGKQFVFPTQKKSPFSG